MLLKARVGGVSLADVFADVPWCCKGENSGVKLDGDVADAAPWGKERVCCANCPYLASSSSAPEEVVHS